MEGTGSFRLREETSWLDDQWVAGRQRNIFENESVTDKRVSTFSVVSRRKWNPVVMVVCQITVSCPCCPLYGRYYGRLCCRCCHSDVTEDAGPNLKPTSLSARFMTHLSLCVSHLHRLCEFKLYSLTSAGSRPASGGGTGDGGTPSEPPATLSWRSGCTWFHTGDQLIGSVCVSSYPLGLIPSLWGHLVLVGGGG